MGCDLVEGKDEKGRPWRGIVCSRGQRPPDIGMCQTDGCSARAERLCDWPAGEGKTCDKKICPRCAKRVGPDKDYCEEHYVESLR